LVNARKMNCSWGRLVKVPAGNPWPMVRSDLGSTLIDVDTTKVVREIVLVGTLSDVDLGDEVGTLSGVDLGDEVGALVGVFRNIVLVE
jgi:hypothetical protein